MTKSKLYKTTKEFFASEIVYYPVYIKIAPSYPSALLLSSLIYNRHPLDEPNDDKESLKTIEELREELYMPSDILELAKDSLIELDLISVDVRGSPYKTFYKLNKRKIYTLIMEALKND